MNLFAPDELDANEDFEQTTSRKQVKTTSNNRRRYRKGKQDKKASRMQGSQSDNDLFGPDEFMSGGASGSGSGFDMNLNSNLGQSEQRWNDQGAGNNVLNMGNYDGQMGNLGAQMGNTLNQMGTRGSPMGNRGSQMGFDETQGRNNGLQVRGNKGFPQLSRP